MKLYTFNPLRVVTGTFSYYVLQWIEDYWNTPVILFLPFILLLYPFRVVYNFVYGTYGLSKSMDTLLNHPHQTDIEWLTTAHNICIEAERQTGVNYGVLKESLDALRIIAELKKVDNGGD